MGAGAYKNIRSQNAEQFRKGVRVYDPKHDFSKAIYEACALECCGSGRINLLDAMSGPGRLGRDLKARFYRAQSHGRHKGRILSVDFNELMEEPLMALAEEGHLTLKCDIRKLGGPELFHDYHVIVVRFGLKDLPEDGQLDAIHALKRALVPGGRLVIADMYAPSPMVRDSVNTVHAEKQKLAGRDEAAEGRCYIPLAEEWMAMLNGAGFFPVKSVFFGHSEIDTRDWTGQFGPEADDGKMIARMNRVIGGEVVSNPKFEEQFSVRYDEDRVTLRFPVMVVAGDRL